MRLLLAPSAPQRLSIRLLQPSDKPPYRVKLSWEQPESLNGLLLEHYRLIYGPKSEQQAEGRDFTLTVENTDITLENLHAGQDYTFRLAAKNAIGYGEEVVESIRTEDSGKN